MEQINSAYIKSGKVTNMKKTKIKSKVCYACEVCGFAYEDEDSAKECEQWCNTYHNCNMELAKKAVNFKK